MSRWVKPEYEGVLAFIFIAIGTVIPWSVTAGTIGNLGSAYSIRWWIGEMRYFTSISEFSGWKWVHESISLQVGNSVFLAYVAWGIGTIVLIGTILLGSSLLIKEEEITGKYPIHLIAGSLLFGVGIVYSFGTLWISLYGIPGMHIPIGGMIYIIFGLLLLTNRYNSDDRVVGTESTSTPVDSE